MPAVPVRRIFVWFAVSVVFSAIAIANVATALAPEPLSEASSALRGSIASVISVDTNGLIDAAEKFDAASGAAAVIVISLALYLISALPITSFRLKRMLLNLTPTDAQKLADTAAIDHVSRARGVYRDERAAFGSLGVPPPREIPFDLIAQATLMLLPLLLGISLADRQPRERRATASRWTAGRQTSLVALAWLCLVVRSAGSPHLLGIWRRRVRDAADALPPQRFTPRRARHARPPPRGVRGRLAARGLASVLVLLPSGGRGRRATSSRRCGGSSASRSCSPRVTVPFMLREGERAGQTLGKQLFGLSVVCDDHGVSPAPRDRARAAREGAVLDRLDLAAVHPGGDQLRVVGPRPRAARAPGPRSRHARRARDPPPQ